MLHLSRGKEEVLVKKKELLFKKDFSSFVIREIKWDISNLEEAWDCLGEKIHLSAEFLILLMKMEMAILDKKIILITYVLF